MGSKVSSNRRLGRSKKVAEYQQDWLGIDRQELTEKKMTRFTLAGRRNVEMTCAKIGNGLGFSAITRIMWNILSDRILNYPPEMRREPTKEMEGAVDQFVAVIPVLKKQIEQSPRGYYRQSL